MNDTKLADLAVSILSQLPTPKVEAFSAGGGVVILELQSQDGAYILADAPRQLVRPYLDLLVRTNEISGGGYDISLTVEDTLHQTEWMIGVRLRVEEFIPGGMNLQDARIIAQRLVSTGVSMIEISAETAGDAPVARRR